MAFEFWLRKTRVVVGGKNEPICPNSILLLKDKPVSFGRSISGETNVRLLSKSAPLMISRKHATVSFSKALGKWTMVDHDSLNGVFLNGTKIQGSTPFALKCGDKITFGVGIDLGPPEFEYTFEVLMANRKKRQAESQLPSGNNEAKHRKVLAESEVNINQPSGSKVCSFTTLSEPAQDKIEQLKLSLEEKEKCYRTVVQQLDEMEKDLQIKLLEQKGVLESEKEELENNLKQLLTEKLHEKEQLLNQQLMDQKTQLIAEKERVEIELQKELNRKLEEKDKELENELTCQKEALDEVIAEKEARQEALQKEVACYREAQDRLESLEATEHTMKSALLELQQLVQEKDEELQKQQEFAKKAEETARKTVVQEMEDEFTCIVCQELFINAITLSCTHSFCDYCVQLWMNKKNNCPMCRHPVRGRPIRSIVLDNAIAKMVEAMDDEAKAHRQEIVDERKNLQRAMASTTKVQHERSSQHNRHPVSEGNRGHREEHNMVREVRNVEPRPGPSHYHHDNNRYNHRDVHPGYDGNGGGNAYNQFIEGIPGSWYPGHGHCYICATNFSSNDGSDRRCTSILVGGCCSNCQRVCKDTGPEAVLISDEFMTFSHPAARNRRSQAVA